MHEYDDWIGRSFDREDVITPRMLTEFRATFPGLLAPGDVPPGFHWCCAPEVVKPENLGRDGHPRTGLYLPKLPLPRRMWAGGEIETLGEFAPGDKVTRHSRIRDVTFKTGRSGPLGFVTVDHVYSAGNNEVVRERQDLVYREDPDPDAEPPEPPFATDWDVAEHWIVSTDPVLLFRYSALTFNGHRIHYDAAYAREVEGYAGLVVHGPMQALWMQNLAATVLGHPARLFSYRAMSPLTAGHDVAVEARRDDGKLDLRVRRLADHVVTMTARAEG